MRELADRGFFLLYGLWAAVFREVGIAYIAGLFLTIALSSCTLFLRRRWMVGTMLALGCAAICFWPETGAFLPLLFYCILDSRCPGALPFAGAAALWGSAQGAAFAVYILLGAAAAFLLWERKRKLEKREEQLRHTQDDGTEKALLLKRRNQELQEKQDYETYAAMLRERNRIAREIHDNVGHLLARSILMTGAVQAMNREASLSGPLRSLEDSLKEAMDSVRRSVHDLHDDSVDLREASERLVREFTFCSAKLEYDMETAVPGKVKYCFLAVLKEALANVMKHSDATEVRVAMREHPAFYQFEIRDNGSRRRDSQGGMGLINMEERVRGLDGVLKLSRESGFRIFISIPKERG